MEINNVNKLHNNSNNINKQREDEALLAKNILNENYEKGSKFQFYSGLIYSMISTTLFSICAVIVKYLNNLDPPELALIRFMGIFAFSSLQVVFNCLNPFGARETLHLMLLRGVFGGVSFLLRCYCIQNLPIAEAIVIIFSFPIVVTIMAKVYLKVSFLKYF